jgi:hypothetical protein
MAFNPLDYLKDLVPENTNIFGASPNPNIKKMYDMGLLGKDKYQDMLDKANKQSLFQGLLATGLSYAAQPKNQGYGSIFPYFAKAGLAGVQAARNPYDQMGQDAMMNYKLSQMKKEIDDTKTKEDYLATYGTPNTTRGVQIGMENVSAAPRVANTENYPNLLMGGNNLGMPTIAPNYNLEPKAVMQDVPYFDENKFLEGAVAAKALDPFKLIEMRQASGKTANYKMLTDAEVKSGVYGNLDPSQTYQINTANNQVSVFDANAENKLQSNEFARLAFAKYNKKNVNDLTANEVSEINKIMELSEKEKAALSGGIVPIGSAGQNEIDKQFLENTKELQRFSGIKKLFNSEYLTVPARIKAFTLAGKEKLGATLNVQDAQFLKDFTKFQTATLQQLNDYIVKITGAAVGQGEESTRLKSSVPNKDDSPSVFQSKMELLTKDLKLTQARLYYLKKQGYTNFSKGFKDISLDDMPSIMAKREKELTEKYVPKGQTLEQSPQAQLAITRALADEFGLQY